MKSIGVISLKGGSGKTTTASALAAALRSRGRGYVTALLDCDPEGALGMLDPTAERVETGGLHLALRRAAGSDFVIVDCPPVLIEPTRAAAELCDGLVLSTRPVYSDLRAVGNLLQRVDQAKILAVTVVAFRRRVLHHRLVLSKIEELPFQVVVVPFSIATADAALAGRDLLHWAPARRRGLVDAYQKLAEITEERWQKRTR